MAAPSIPNLASLRRGGPRLRGRGDSPSTNTSTRIANPPSQADIHDRIIRATDSDAATSRLSAVAAGYLNDPFAHLLYDTRGKEPPRRLPLMNRGTYVRTTALDRILDTFLASYPTRRKQIISLGAGSDTRYFRLRRKYPDLDIIYHEFDFVQNTQDKVKHLQSPIFASAYQQHCHGPWSYDVPNTDHPGSALISDSYILSPLDLRTLSTTTKNNTSPSPTSPSPTSPSPNNHNPNASPPTTTTNTVNHAASSTLNPTPHINTTLPTLLVSEMALCYLSPALATAAITYFTTHLFPPSTPLSLALYEPLSPQTAFGRTMTANLASRGISLPTLESYPDLPAQKQRLKDLGFVSGQDAVDLAAVWKYWVEPSEKERVEALEWMDEVEEFELLGAHYCVAWGWRGGVDAGGVGGVGGEEGERGKWGELSMSGT